jgi:putative phage-type endonuclease
LQANIATHVYGPGPCYAAPEDAAPFANVCRSTNIRQTDRARWLEQRKLGLGGSEVAALFGLHPYKSALEVYADKVDAMPANDTSSEVALWGQLFEEPILREYARRSGRELVFSNELLIRLDRPWHRCTPDAIQLTLPPAGCEGPGIGECKMTGFGDWNEEIPPHVLVQVQHELWVTGAEWGTLIWLPVPERKLEWRDMLPNREFAALLAETCDAFWTRVLERSPPDADGSESAKRALFHLEPDLADECVEFDDAVLVADELAGISETIKALEARKDFIGNRVLQSLGPYKVGLLPDGRYWNSWRCEPRQETCAGCGQVHRDVGGFRASRLMAPRKKPHGVPRETRSLSVAPSRETAQLLASLRAVKP